MTDPREKYPECAKLASRRDDSLVLSSFVDWLCETGLVLCAFDPEIGEYSPTRESNERLFARYFDIDLNKVEDERRAMLDAMSSKTKEET